KHTATGVHAGFFSWVDGAPAEGYRAPRLNNGDREVTPDHTHAPVAVLTGEYGAQILGPLLDRVGRADVRVLPVENRFFGGNIGVTGLLVGEDIARVLSEEPEDHRYLLPDVCLSKGAFLDGTTPDDLPRPVEVVGTDGVALRQALGV
ncbi:MAG: DUF512 domain-containing protein, partial [Acidimicrobiia bacterium]|nr:DUF512 domain-containing protein [Acidimicrobiia bacterium]